MAISRSRAIYFAIMLVAGIVIGLAAAQQPAWREAVITPAAWPFLVSLVVDIAIGQAAAQGKAEPLTMGDRFVGVIGAGLIVTAILAFST
ncbi:hypothetical protein [Microvirga aerophila]|uniref:Uncharacterized protein n=1 Tax=Microvirga aerophila TaxID=670291 RepID=A0A512BMC9_9HYPH|nr:hypothetical protein [Microvirga aerophila]GEO13114.1 hypothetical protein MAE02_08100 [Microvirga aerophila]